jgi:hypothetical protein
MTWKNRNGWGTSLLGIWLIATGALPLVSVQIPWAGLILSGLAIAAGIMILRER